jgi:hypothetical membrane protein
MHHRFRKIRWAFALAAALTLASMFCYPGGTPLDPTTTRYSLSHNFLSDLGMTVSYSGQRNRFGALLFVGGLLCLITGAALLLLAFVRLCSTSARARRFARAAGALALASCLAFVGVAFTPENRVMSLHVDFTFWAFRVAPFATLLLTFAAHESDALPPRVTHALAALTAVLACTWAFSSGARPSSLRAASWFRSSRKRLWRAAPL